MNVSRLRAADRWLGAPLCFLLTLRRRILGEGIPDPGEPRSILFVKPAEQGSTVLAWAAIARAVEIVGRDRVYFIVFAENRPILDLLDVVPAENILEVETGSLPAALRSSLRAVRRCRRAGIDTALDLEFFARSSAAYAYLSGARRRVGLHAFAGEGPWRGNLMTHRVGYDPGLHTGALYLGMVEIAALPAGDFPAPPAEPPPVTAAPPPFTPDPGEVAAVRALLQEEAGWDGHPLFLLNANCSDLLPLRRWPGERYVELARRLVDRYPQALVVFTGAPGEEAAVGDLVRTVGSPRCVSLAGRTTLRQLLALFSIAEVLVTNDSGPAQFAALTPVDAVVLFGPETPARFAPRSIRSHVLFAGLPCSPCVSALNDRRSRCRDNRCLQAITVGEVFAKACALHERRRGA